MRTRSSAKSSARKVSGICKSRSVNQLSLERIDQWQREFNLNPANKVARNAIVTVGSRWASTNVDEARKVDHIFLNSVKAPDSCATNQMYSGRCWIFAGLNMFRHMIMKALNTFDFEFSQTYLFFYDKLEKSNMFLGKMIEYRRIPWDPNDWSNPESRYVSSLVAEPVFDGGYWNMFANLVDKYGLVPKSAMPETFQSENSGDMNTEINHRLRTWACLIREKYSNLSDRELQTMRVEWVKQIHSILVKYLGPPPTTFQFSFRQKNYEIGDDDDNDGIVSILKANDGQRMPFMTPKQFKEMLLPGISLADDFVTIGNYPRICPGSGRSEWNNCYEVEHTTNVEGGSPLRLYNMSINDMRVLVSTSIDSGQPVWFAADVSKGFDQWHSALDDKLIDNESVFGPLYKLDKGQRLAYLDSHGNHAMTFTGVDYDNETGRPFKWQVENSWGFFNSNVPGLDGFLYMNDDWFGENVFQVIIMKKVLEISGNGRMLLKRPIVLKPWDSAAKSMTALKDSNVKPQKPTDPNSKILV